MAAREHLARVAGSARAVPVDEEAEKADYARAQVEDVLHEETADLALAFEASRREAKALTAALAVQDNSLGGARGCDGRG